MSISEVKAEILNKYASVHAFCKAHKELSRASVYLVLSGKYPGNAKNQLKRIKAALTGHEAKQRPQPPVSQEMLGETLQAIRCSNCRRLNRRECMACRDQTAREAMELFERLYDNGEGMEKAGQL
ncbi:MAG: hypothetical protein K2H64_03485 [Desulfovibrio sp.]|nr:hypothetical protein [Desulfovibrio sp.]